MSEQAIEQQVALPKYNLTTEQEKKLILRQYRALLKVLRPKLKKGDEELIRRAFEIAAEILVQGREADADTHEICVMN